MSRPSERSTTPSEPATPSAETDVFCVAGASPEVQAYAMAKYSRSALSLRETLAELNQQKAEQFLNTFYFQYGHRSIADLAHLTMAIERLSLLAAIAVVDEQRWDGQERSTRYQDFRKSGWFVPEFQSGDANGALYRESVAFLFSEYEWISARVFEYLRERTPRPPEMKQEAYERTLRARAFDVARYLLPLATNTSLGQIVSSRTLETQIARLLADPHAEVRRLGERLKEAAQRGAHDVNHESRRKLVEEIRRKDPALAARAAAELLASPPVSPTLVKYAEASQYESRTRDELRQAACELMAGAAISAAPEVTLLDPEPIEVELATTLLYQHCHYPYRQIRERVEALGAARRDEIVALGAHHRGAHDELLRAFCAGQSFRFDILMDIGGYRDMHRHRRCTQIAQDFTTAHGFAVPEEIAASGLKERYGAAMQRAESAVRSLSQPKESTTAVIGEVAPEAQYLIPLAFGKRTLFKMDLAEVVYISELRTSPAGHWSYRNISWQMYDAVARRHPSLAQFFRVHDIHAPVDLLKR